MSSRALTTQTVAQIIVFVSIIVFAIFSLTYKNASRDYKRWFQYRGLSLAHLFLFTMLGMALPNHFWAVQLMGVLFELANYAITHIKSHDTKRRILNIIGGSFAPGHGYITEVHWLDRLIFGEYPTTHWWHPKVTDILMNILGFMLGRWMVLKNK